MAPEFAAATTSDARQFQHKISAFLRQASVSQSVETNIKIFQGCGPNNFQG